MQRFLHVFADTLDGPAFQHLGYTHPPTPRAAILRILRQDQVQFHQPYEYLTLAPAPADAGAFSMAAPAAAPAPASSSDLNEATLGRLADEMQRAMEQHGLQSAEFGEAQARTIARMRF